MDITLIRTFLEVAATGSFVSAADRLFVTQSAVSLRIQRLEKNLGRPLFTRSKAGAELTPAGHAFERFALSMVTLWEEARHEVAIPEGFSRTLTIAAEYSLWPRLGFRWVDRLQSMVPELDIWADMGAQEILTRHLREGVIDCALTYSPQLRPGIEAREILKDELILVASWPNPTPDLDGRYIFVDWGPEFTRSHAISLPMLKNSGLTLALGALGADYIVNRRAAAYLPARYVKRYLDNNLLHLVPDAPRFPHPIWVVWRNETDPIIRASADAALSQVCADLDEMHNNVLDSLADLSGGTETPVLGTNSNGG